MKKVMLSLILSCTLVVGMSVGSFADTGTRELTIGDSTVDYINNIYQSYYVDIPSTFSDLKNEEENTIDTSTLVEKFTIDIELSTKENQDKFIKELTEGNSLLEMASPDNDYYALCDQGEWGVGTAILNQNGDINQVFVADKGETYLLDLNNSLQRKLEESSLELDKTSARFVAIPMYSTGIVFSDGKTECYLPKLIRGGELEINNLYTISEIVNDIEKNSEDILYEGTLLTNEYLSEDGRMNPPTGDMSKQKESSNILYVFLSLFILSTVSFFVFRKRLKKDN